VRPARVVLRVMSVAELLARPNVLVRPGIDPDAPGGPTLQVTDPYGNVLRFAQPPSAQ